MSVIDVTIRTDEGCAPEPNLLWDTVWNAEVGAGDWALAKDEPLNRGGLAARQAIHTAVVLALFTDRRCPPDHPLARFADGDLRGWWGDGIDVRDDLGEQPLGSLLWLLERASLLTDTERWAESFAIEALQPLIDQGAAVRAKAKASADRARNRLNLDIVLIGRDGARVYDRRFDVLWRQTAAG
jgi:phage gp46-like protein